VIAGAGEGVACVAPSAPRTLRVTIEIGKLAIDPASYRVSHSGKPVSAEHARKFRLLY